MGTSEHAGLAAIDWFFSGGAMEPGAEAHWRAPQLLPGLGTLRV
jgi:hypothetical protein